MAASTGSFRFTLVPRSRQWIQGADLPFDLAIENLSGSAVQVPDPMISGARPVYLLIRPDGTKVTFTPGGEGASAQPLTPVVTIPAGEVWNGDMTLNLHAAISEVGMYELSATIKLLGENVVATPATFEISPAKFRSLSVAFGQSETGGYGAEGLLLQVSGAKLEAVAAAFVEKHASIMEADARGFDPLGEVPRETVNLLAPRANYGPSDRVDRWVVATETAQATVLEWGEELTTCAKFSGVVSSWLTPVAGADGSLSILAVTGKAKSVLELARCQVEGSGTVTSVPLVLDEPLSEGELYGADCVLGPPSLGGQLFIVLSRKRGDGMQLQLLKLVHDTKLEEVDSLSFREIAGTPYVRIDVDRKGGVFLAAVAHELNDNKTAVVLRAVLEATAGAKLATSNDSLRIELDSDLVDAQFGAVDRGNGNLDRVLLLRRLRGSARIVALSSGASCDTSSPLPLRSKFGLVPMRGGWYAAVLTGDRVRLLGL